MKHIKNWNLFTESYSDDLSQVLSDTDNKFVLIDSGNIESGFKELIDAFSHIAKLLGDDNILTEEQVEEYNNDIQNASINNDMEQEDINTVLNDLLDKYEIIAPYRIENRSELEETPIERDYSVDNVMENYVIQGTLNGEVKEIEPFDSKEVADSLLDDYKKIYTEYENLEVVPKK